MTIYIKGHDFHYEMENLCRVFFPNEKLTVTRELTGMQSDPSYVFLERQQTSDGNYIIRVHVLAQGEEDFASETIAGDGEEAEQQCERRMAVLLYRILTKLTGIVPSWGILTGVRPIKLLRRLVETEGGEAQASRYFTDQLLVTPGKTQLALQTMHEERRLFALSRPESFSLYVSIPFCPTRCAYCSFVSQTVERAAKLIPDYVDLLCQELEQTAAIASALSLRLETIYFGGGTPTTLTAQQLARLIEQVRKCFDLTHCREFTVEAGRPDTITVEKLQALKDGGVDRISINPQTLNDDVLAAIGRRHSAAQVLQAYDLARQMGVDNINMDLIAGLPQDTAESFQATLDQVVGLAPESITVHTLAMKRSAQYTLQGMRLYKEACETAQAMLDYSDTLLPKHEYSPYYLYRQSRMVGNLENVGWSKPGKEGLYNVYAMDETHSVLACGAGAVTKLRDPHSSYLERVFNFKYPYEYISRFDEMLQRKEKIPAFYEVYRP